MTPRKPRPQRAQFTSKVRFVVSGKGDIEERFAENLSEGGLFIRHDTPPPKGSLVMIEFVLPDGRPLSRAAVRVIHSRPAIRPGDEHAGMGLEFVKLDKTTREIAARLDSAGSRRPQAVPREEVSQPRLTDLHGMEAPLITASGPIIGIDLGTVNSCVAVVNDARPHVVLSPGGYDTVPSVVFLSEGGDLSVGHKAVERMILHPDRAVYGSKRFLGRPFRSREVQTFGHFFTWDLVAGDDGAAAARIGDQVITLEEVAAQILTQLRQMAEKQLGTSVSRAVITVPAYFGETQRRAVRDAGRLAGLQTERILSEPTAAAVAYGYGRGMTSTVLVYDLGGGTFDATILRVDHDAFEVLATDGDPFLGGTDFDDRLTEYVLTSFERSGGPTLRTDPVAVQRVRFAVELAKRQLSEATTADLDLPYVATGDDGPVHLRMLLSRDQLERLTADLVTRSLTIVQKVLDRAGLTTDQLDDVLLVGGQSRSPHVRRSLIERFERQPSSAVHPTEAVALGAALIAEALHSELHVHLADVLPASIQLAESDGHTRVLLERGVRLPASTELEVEASSDGMNEIRVVLYRGEATTTAGNTFLGALVFPSIASTAEVASKARITIKISGDGLMTVSALHPTTGERKELELSLIES
jgi:molecular chaperone DnaK